MSPPDVERIAISNTKDRHLTPRHKMFQKPFKVKSHSAIKGSDRKKLRSDICSQFPKLTAEEFNDLIPNKSEMSSMKLCTHSGDFVTAYFLQKNPIFFEMDKIFYPTVYTLWRLPDLLPKFTTWQTVFDKLNSGADLMLPGIILPSNEELSPRLFGGNLEKGDLCAVNLRLDGDYDVKNNSAAIAVGVTALSSQDMFLSGKRGKGVLIRHTYMDNLWAQGDKTHPPNEKNVEVEEKDLKEVEKEDNQEDKEEETVKKDEDEVGESELCENNGENSKSPVELMDDLLTTCFLRVWKLHGKKIELPLLTSTFYKNYMIPECPKNSTLDVKKSSYKKMSKFLQSMQEKGIIQVKELSKGVESIVGVDLSHFEIRKLEINLDQLDLDAGSTSEPIQSESKYEFPHVTELYMITADVLKVFKSGGFSKGSTLTASDIRRFVKHYVIENKLQNEHNKNLVDLDDTLRQSLHCQEMNLKWEELTTRLLNKMSPAYQLKFKNQEPIIKKGKLEPIQLSISQRAANKKVTLIYNLHVYNIDPNTIAHALQIGVAASTCVSPAANKKEGQEVLVQGNQIKFIARLLLDEYKVPSKYIKGLELAPKQNKKR